VDTGSGGRKLPFTGFMEMLIGTTVDSTSRCRKPSPNQPKSQIRIKK